MIRPATGIGSCHTRLARRAAVGAGILVLVLLTGCARVAGEGMESKVQEYLSGKYGETFVLEDTSDDTFLPVRVQETPIFHPRADALQLFTVQEVDGDLHDERVLAAWDRRMESEYSPRVQSIFGEAVGFRIRGGAPSSWELGKADLESDPSTLFADKSKPSSVEFLIAVPVKGPLDLKRYYSPIRAAWALVKEANPGDGRPQLLVYFYKAGNDPSRFMALSAIPGVTTDWAGIPGAIGRLEITVYTPVETDADLKAAYFDGGTAESGVDK